MVTTTTGLATSFITFTRTSNATVTDSNGFIEWAGHNLLTNSESFDTASYGTVGLLAFGSGSSANSAAAPNGTTTAEYLRETNANSRHFIFANPSTVAGANYTARVFVKAGERTFVALGIRTTDGVTGYAAAFNLSTGAMTATSSTGTPTNTSAPTPVAVGSGWYLLSVSMDATTSSAYVEIGLSDSATPTFAAGMPTYTGTGTSGLYVWGAHFYRSDLGGMVLNPARGDAYYPTTPRNLLGWTEDFSAAAWVKTNILAFGSGSISNAIVAPNGLQTADKIVSSTANNNHRVQWSVAGVLVSNTKYVFSFYAKAAEYTKVQIADAVYSVYSARFDLTGSGSVVASSGCTAAITSVGDGWYRCSAIYTSGGANAWAHISPYPDSGATFSVDGASYTGDGTSGIYVWGAQLSDSASLDAYSPVYGAAVTSAAYYAPRLDYSGSSLAALGLLVEEQRTNVLLHSNDFSQAAWADAAPTSVVTVAANSTASPDGSTNAAKLTASTGGANAMARQARTLVASTVYSGSIYIKGDTSTQSRMLLRDTTSGVNFADATITWTAGVPSIAGGATGTWSAVPVGGNWYRIVGTGTTGASPTPLVTFSLFPDTAAGTNAIFAYGAQLEAGSFATSYIPTGASTATRTADVASVSTQAFPYSATEGTIVASGDLLGSAYKGVGDYYFALSNGTTSEAILIADVDGSVGQIHSGGVVQYNQTVGTRPAINTPIKVGIAFASNNVNQATNGTLGTNDTAVAMPAVSATTLTLGVRGDLTNPSTLNGHIRQITYLPRRITNAELQARTA